MITVITMYRGYDAEIFVQVVNGTLTQEQRTEWRKTFHCDEFSEEEEDEESNMFFRELNGMVAPESCVNLLSADGEAGEADDD